VTRHPDPGAFSLDRLRSALAEHGVDLTPPPGWEADAPLAAALWIYTGLGAPDPPDLLRALSGRPREDWPRAARQIEADWSGGIGGLLLVRIARHLLDPAAPVPVPQQLAVHLDPYERDLARAATAAATAADPDTTDDTTWRNA
jgi:hypothetical protein